MAVVISYNVNGIRAALNKGFMNWLAAANPDILCLQEIKAQTGQLDLTVFEKAGYHHYWFPAEKKGYSGVAILTKKIPDHVEYGCGIKKYDAEGRILRADYGNVSVMSVYMPSGSSSDIRQEFKMQWLSDFEVYMEHLRMKRPEIIISGDYNICHKPIDIHDPVRNVNSSGFLPEEREWLDRFINTGMLDSFRQFNKEPHNYSWWSYRSQARKKNLGWRIDYNLVSRPLAGKMKRALILPDAMHSDHCPIYVEVDF